jgi:DNA-binding NtrC family response regulator
VTQAIIDDLILGESEAIRAVRVLIRKIAPRREPVLIQGPTGSGKELVAQALHAASGRPGRFVPFNVCAIPETMFEDSLFGHVRGAFTGAAGDSQGYLLEADKGTAFFDEVSGLSLPMQVKLLRAIETGEFRPVGARGDKRSSFRVVAALNEPLDEMLDTGRFRHDLAHRLGTFVIDVPPLETRMDDVPFLARHFAERAEHDHAPRPVLTPCALRALQQHDWPGNVRELRNVVFSTIALAETSTITGEMIVRTLTRTVLGRSQEGRPGFQRKELIKLLEACSWNTAEVARRLGVDRATVYRRMTALGVPTLSRNVPSRTSKENATEAYGSELVI